MELVIDARGSVTCVYGEVIPLAELGDLTIRRASHVEPDSDGKWWADLAPVTGPLLGPFVRRSLALDAERQWLEHALANKQGVVVVHTGHGGGSDGQCDPRY